MGTIEPFFPSQCLSTHNNMCVCKCVNDFVVWVFIAYVMQPNIFLWKCQNESDDEFYLIKWIDCYFRLECLSWNTFSLSLLWTAPIQNKMNGLRLGSEILCRLASIYSLFDENVRHSWLLIVLERSGWFTTEIQNQWLYYWKAEWME